MLLLPADAIKVRASHSYVLLAPAQPNGQPVEKEVKTGLSDGKHVEVLEGVSEKDRLLVVRIRASGSEGTSSPFMPFGRKR